MSFIFSDLCTKLQKLEKECSEKNETLQNIEIKKKTLKDEIESKFKICVSNFIK